MTSIFDRALEVACEVLEGSGGRWAPMAHQIPPPLTDPWDVWLLMGGRGTGKTDAAAHWINEHALGPACDARLQGGHRMLIIAPTQGDAVESCITGPSGLKAHNPEVRLVQQPGGTIVRWPNGSEAKVLGAHSPEDVERLRAAGNRCAVWVEELAAWRKLLEVWQQMEFGLRLGERPRVVGSTTPKPRPLIQALDLIARNQPLTPKLLQRVGDIGKTVRLSHGTTDDNPHLPEAFRSALKRTYEGTRLGRQELKGEILTDVEGAHWNSDMIESGRCTKELLEDVVLARVVTGVDPSGGADLIGIVAAGRTTREAASCPGCGSRENLPHFFVLEDGSLQTSPRGWARKSITVNARWDGDRIVGEKNFGGDMVESTIRSVDPDASYKSVTASRGKARRAEPIVALYEQGRVHHVGRKLEELEEEMTTWTEDADWSPNRMDAAVWALTELSGGRTPTETVAPSGVEQSNPWKMA